MSQGHEPLSALVAIVVSIPTLTTFIENMLKSNETYGYSMIITLLVKGVIAAHYILVLIKVFDF